MINLIRNELYKLLRPWLLLPFLLCLCIAAGYFFHFRLTHLPETAQFTDKETVSHLIDMLHSDPDAAFELDKYQFILDEQLLLPIDSWQMSALDLAFSVCGKQIAAEETSPRRVASYYRYQKLYCDAVLSDNHQSYLQLLAEQVQNDARLSAADKYSYSLYYSFLISQNVVPQTDDWREQAAYDLLDSRLTLSSLESISENEVPNYDNLWQQAYNRQVIAEYRIAHNIALFITERTKANSLLWLSLFDSSQMYALLYLPLILLFGGIISSEYQHRQLGLLLTCPVRRRNYWIAKTFCMFIICTASIVTFFLLRVLLAGIFLGFGDLSAVALFVHDGQVSAYPTLLLLLRNDVIAGIPLYVMCAFILLCSTALPRTSLVFLFSGCALLLTAFSYLTPNAVLQGWMKYTVFGTANLLHLYEHSSIWNFLRSLLIQLLHLILYLGCGIWLFKRKRL